MRVIFDAQIFIKQRAGGVSRYYTKLAEMMEEGCDVTVKIIAPLHRNDILDASTTANVFGVCLPQMRGAGRLCSFAHRLIAPGLGVFLNGDIVHETYFSAQPYLPVKAARVTTVHDMIHERYYSQNRVTLHKKASVERSDHVICVSHNTKNDLCEMLGVPPERVSVTHLAYQDFSASRGSSAPEELGGAPYFLFVGNRPSHKNAEALVRAVAMNRVLSGQIKIACFGGDVFTEAEKATVHALGLPPDVMVHLKGDDQKLGTAYANATAFVYPSLYEGFGMPPLEAMSAGCPVICSNTSSMPEVVGEAALMFDPHDIEALSDAMTRIAESQDLSRDLIQRGHVRRELYSWQRCASETIQIYRRIA